MVFNDLFYFRPYYILHPTMPHLIFTLSATTILLSVLVVAPFPPTHPYNFLNTIIEPSWLQLDSETQAKVYSVWAHHEPFLLAKAKSANLLERKTTVTEDTLKALKELIKAKVKSLISIKADEETIPVHENEEYSKDGIIMEKSEVKYKSYVQQKWEELQGLVQYKSHLFVTGQRAEYEAFEEFVRLLKAKKETLKPHLHILKEAIKSLKKANKSKEAETEDENH